jgi:2-polyprenyl-3-methyl-5-hydroxy-6-metoxy-1,4-benzoquinol methylase
MENSIVDVLSKVANQYPVDMVAGQVRDIPRIAFHIGLALESTKPTKNPSELEICDLGGGLGLFSVGLAAIGIKRTVLIDDFNDPVNQRVGDSILDLHRSYGVEIVSRDVVTKGINDIEGYFDVITTFESMEHWHNSPKQLFQAVIERLKPSGAFVLGVPNCVNMRKRITVPLGIGKWSGMRDWYEAPEFRGHVREPDVDDLRYISRSMNLRDVRIYGRNWAGYDSANPAIRVATKLLDYPLRLRPSLCSDIYMVGKKPPKELLNK